MFSGNKNHNSFEIHRFHQGQWLRTPIYPSQMDEIRNVTRTKPYPKDRLDEPSQYQTFNCTATTASRVWDSKYNRKSLHCKIYPTHGEELIQLI